MILGTSNQDSVGLKYLMVRSMFTSTPKNGKYTCALALVYLSNTTAARSCENAAGSVQGNC